MANFPRSHKLKHRSYTAYTIKSTQHVEELVSAEDVEEERDEKLSDEAGEGDLIVGGLPAIGNRKFRAGEYQIVEEAARGVEGKDDVGEGGGVGGEEMEEGEEVFDVFEEADMEGVGDEGVVVVVVEVKVGDGQVSEEGEGEKEDGEEGGCELGVEEGPGLGAHAVEGGVAVGLAVEKMVVGGEEGEEGEQESEEALDEEEEAPDVGVVSVHCVSCGVNHIADI
ncbi:hypothetical protein CYMTET_33371 [Cymbomonas tetramitiformis]|uniref:Uncharacterized protein n=1 Tax=Cymbomonas tetramitiformis TaxID=36881 RepID=A0AAE0FDU9_9CHLO|nr:hypothetical protein CYMTET_33371 [Cymbomonas tetramitiformis]